MSGHRTTETFFCPPAVASERTTIAASLYNRCRLMLSRCGHDCVFVPLRSMQYLAVIDAREIIFVDSLRYAVSESEGGRMIMMAWKFGHEGVRDSLSEPVPVELVFYAEGLKELGRRIMAELPKALELLECRSRERGCESGSRKVVPFPG